jgi:hypothetical protein
VRNRALSQVVPTWRVNALQEIESLWSGVAPQVLRRKEGCHMGVTVSRRGLLLAATPLLTAGLVATSTIGAAAWTFTDADTHCTGVVHIMGKDLPTGTQVVLDFYVGPEVQGSVFQSEDVTSKVTANGTIDVNVQLNASLLGQKPDTDITVAFRGHEGEQLAHDTFDVPAPCPVPPASGPRTNPPGTPAPSGGGAGTPGLPNTGFDPYA